MGLFTPRLNISEIWNLKAVFGGNVLIAIGGILPGIGGTATKFGHTYVLYITELLGLLFIFAGYQIIRNDSSLSIHQNQNKKRLLDKYC